MILPGEHRIFGPGAPSWLQDRIIMLTIAGSRLYGTDVPSSDWDMRGVCVPPRECIYGIHDFEQYHVDVSSESDDVDLCVYSLRKFVSLAAQCNPNVVEILWSPPEKHVLRHPLWDGLYAIRDVFLSKIAFKSFSGYAMSQLRKMQASYAKTGAYDTKNAMHLVRLMRMGVEILRDGEVNVVRPDADYLISIRYGEVSLDQVVAEHDALYQRMEILREASLLPDGPDYHAINAVAISITEAAVRDPGGRL